MGDVRGKGLYVGVEFVKDKETREPAPEILKQAQEHCFQRGVILWKGGRWNNVARFMPALVITEGLLDQGIEIFEEVLRSIESK